MSTFTLFLITSLASFRLTRIITTDTITEVPREWLLKRYPPDHEHARLHKRRIALAHNAKPITAWAPDEHLPDRKINKLGVLISCPWCAGWYLSALVVAVVANLQSVELPVLWWLAVSAVVGLIARNLDADA